MTLSQTFTFCDDANAGSAEDERFLVDVLLLLPYGMVKKAAAGGIVSTGIMITSSNVRTRRRRRRRPSVVVVMVMAEKENERSRYLLSVSTPHLKPRKKVITDRRFLSGFNEVSVHQFNQK
jgi:hypothetical protein